MEGTIIAGVVTLILVITIVALYNGIIGRKNAVQRAWADVITQERQKNQILPRLEEIVKEHKEFESGLLSKITQLRSAVSGLSNKDVDPDALKRVEQETRSVMEGLRVAVEAYPDLKTAGLMANLMREVADQQDNIAAAIRIFNQNVEAFNNGIEMFPGSLVNAAFNKEGRQKSFNDEEAATGFDFQPGRE